MTLKTEKLIGTVLLLALVGIAVWGHFNLPDAPMAVHFDWQGVADGFQPRDQAIWIGPGIALGLYVLLLWILPPIMPKSGSIVRSVAVYGLIALLSLGLLAVVQAMLVLTAAGVVMDHTRIIFSAVGLLFIVLGNFMPKMRRNWLMGIRNPWTLSDERVWDKTHRFAGPLFMTGGLVTIADALFALVDWRLPILLLAVLIPAAASHGYSYLAAKRLNLI